MEEVNRAAHVVERTYGRLKPHCVSGFLFSSKPEKVRESVENAIHFREGQRHLKLFEDYLCRKAKDYGPISNPVIGPAQPNVIPIFCRPPPPMNVYCPPRPPPPPTPGPPPAPADYVVPIQQPIIFQTELPLPIQTFIPPPFPQFLPMGPPPQPVSDPQPVREKGNWDNKIDSFLKKIENRKESSPSESSGEMRRRKRSRSPSLYDRRRRRSRDRVYRTPERRRPDESSRRSRSADNSDKSGRKYEKRYSPARKSPKETHRRKKSPSPGKAPRRQSLSPHTRRYNEYQTELKNIQKHHSVIWAGFMKQPDSHPFYNEDWKMFWLKKNEELFQRGYNPRVCKDLIKEQWHEFFRNKLLRLETESYENKKANLKKSMGLNRSPSPPDKAKFESREVRMKQEERPEKPRSSEGYKPKVSEDRDHRRSVDAVKDRHVEPRSSERYKQRISEGRGHRRSNDEAGTSEMYKHKTSERREHHLKNTNNDSVKNIRTEPRRREAPSQKKRDHSEHSRSEPSRKKYKEASSKENRKQVKGELPDTAETRKEVAESAVFFLSTIHRVALLQKHLGHLANNVNLLLSNLLTMEKEEANSSQAIINKPEVQILLRNVKGKLLSLKPRTPAIEKVINCVEKLFHWKSEPAVEKTKISSPDSFLPPSPPASELFKDSWAYRGNPSPPSSSTLYKRSSSPQISYESVIPESVSFEGEPTEVDIADIARATMGMNKFEIASKIATTLMLQGKENISEAELMGVLARVLEEQGK